MQSSTMPMVSKQCGAIPRVALAHLKSRRAEAPDVLPFRVHRA
jgi:hypothetical protein